MLNKILSKFCLATALAVVAQSSGVATAETVAIDKIKVCDDTTPVKEVSGRTFTYHNGLVYTDIKTEDSINITAATATLVNNSTNKVVATLSLEDCPNVGTGFNYSPAIQATGDAEIIAARTTRVDICYLIPKELKSLFGCT